MSKNIEDNEKTNPGSTTDEWLSTTIGNFGKWQFWISFLLSLFKLPIAWVQMSIIFLAPSTEYWCAPPLIYQDMPNEKWISMIKPDNTTMTSSQLNNGFCEMKSLDDNHTVLPCQYGYDYNRTVFQSSIITEWDLICGKERLVDISQIILMTGILVGNIIFGLYADRHGRKNVLIICIIIQTVFSFVSSWSPWFWGFVISRFLTAVANGGTLVVSFVMCIEIVGGKWRAIVPILVQAPFGIGYSLMGVLAYYIRNWREFQYVVSGITSLFLWYIWLIPESPRWLFIKGRYEEGKRILQDAAKFNGMKPTQFERNFAKLSQLPTDSKKPNIKDLFSTPVIAKRTSWLCLIWLFSGMSFFTINQYIGHVGQNIFLSTAAGGLLSIPGLIISLYMIRKFGRRNTIAFWSLVSSICFLTIILFPKGMYPHDWQRMVCGGVGIIGISVSLSALYLFTGELLPTVLRNTGLGLCSVSTRIGSMLAPLIITLHDVAPFLPLLILGVLNILQMSLVLTLPETKGKLLPEVISDLEDTKYVNRSKDDGKYIEVSTED